MLLAIGAAFVSAAFFGASSALQQHAASTGSKDDLSGARLLAELAREPRWWLGLALSAVAFALHAVALAGAMLAVVQPIIVSGLVFAVFVRAAFERRLPPRATIGWCLLTWAALAGFIAVVQTGAPQPAELNRAAWCLALGGALVVSTFVAARQVRRDERRGLLFGLGAGVFFGLVAGLAKVVLGQASSQWWLVGTHWPFWALVIVGVGAILLNQRAFQATRLSVTMPVVNIVNVIVAIGFGMAVFGEELFSTPLTLVVEVVAIVAMGVGVRQLARGVKDEAHARPSQPVEDNASARA